MWFAKRTNAGGDTFSYFIGVGVLTINGGSKAGSYCVPIVGLIDYLAIPSDLLADTPGMTSVQINYSAIAFKE